MVKALKLSTWFLCIRFILGGSRYMNTRSYPLEKQLCGSFGACSDVYHGLVGFGAVFYGYLLMTDKE
jgi:hypothetical protein